LGVCAAMQHKHPISGPTTVKYIATLRMDKEV
jgi:hypothetical protein